MVFRFFRLVGLFLICAAPTSIAHAQPGVTANGGVQATRSTNSGWRTPGQQGVRLAAVNAQGNTQPALQPAVPGKVEQAGYSWPGGSGANAPRASARLASVAPVGVAAPMHARVTKGSGTLPNSAGQVWREYDISPYTSNVSTTNRPEQAIVDWILRDTGYEAWHGEPFGILSANKTTLRVYHTPEMHAIVADIVDRFVSSRAKANSFGLRIVTVENPNWRAKAIRLMKPIPVQSPGIQGWLLAKEDAALLISELRRRIDYREHNSPHMLVHNGQPSVISTMRQRTYTKGFTPTGQAWPGYQPEIGYLDEGFSLEFNPLVSFDQRTVDAVVKLRLNQIEKMIPVMLDIPSAAVPNQQVGIEVPQMTTCNLHERFRWPLDKVLLLSMGVVATPEPAKKNVLTNILPIAKTPPRADALLFIENKGRVRQVEAAAATAQRNGPTYYGRY